MLVVVVEDILAVVNVLVMVEEVLEVVVVTIVEDFPAVFKQNVSSSETTSM